MTVSWPYAAAQIQLLDRLGFSKAAAYKVLGVDIEGHIDPAARMAAGQLNKVFEAAETALKDPLIGFRVGYEFRISNFGKTGNIYSYCKDLAEVLAFNARYQPLAVDIGQITTLIEGDAVTGENRYFLDYNLYCENFAALRHVFGLIFGAYGTAFRWLTWSSAYELKGVFLKQDAPAKAAEYTSLFDKIFHCPVYFNQAFNRIEFFEDSMHAPLSTHAPVRKAQMVAQLDKLIASQQAEDSFKDSLRQTTEQAITRGRYGFAHIADALEMPESQLRRRLKDADIKYRQFLDDVRKDMFEQKFTAGMSFAVIAQELGYNDQAAFTRAFKRWHDMTPGQFMANRHDNPTLGPQSRHK